MITLAWNVKELSDTNESGRKLIVDINSLIDRIGTCNWIEGNISTCLTTLQKRVTNFVRVASRHKRTAATHILIFMISPEERNSKPYALPVQCIPYKGLSDFNVRELANVLICEMKKRNMKVAGIFLCFLLLFVHGQFDYRVYN